MTSAPAYRHGRQGISLFPRVPRPRDTRQSLRYRRSKVIHSPAYPPRPLTCSKRPIQSTRFGRQDLPTRFSSALILLELSRRPEKRALTLLVREHLLVVVADVFGLDEAPGELPAALCGQLLARCKCRPAALQPSAALTHAFG